MQSNYKRLGNYIQEVNERDTNMSVTLLLGVSIQKKFIPSIANIIGTDMSTYKIVRQNQFAYGPVTSRNGDKVSIALLDDYEEAIVSQAYTVFKIIDTEQLLPEYLMMWFQRPEFDRYARFKSHGSAREVFDWDELCNTYLPVPDIDKQREIIKEYHTITNRIALNKQLITKLEETAQTIYKQWFVDFEFPDENGQPYKSNGGEMIDSELGEIPKKWEAGKLIDLLELQRGFDLATQHRKNGLYPIYASTGVAEYHNDFKVKGPGVVTGRSGSLGEVFYIEEDFWPLNTTLWVKSYKNATPIFAYYILKSINISDYNSGSAVPTLNRNHIHLHRLIVPKKTTIERFENIERKIFHKIKVLIRETHLLYSLSNLLLSKLSTIEEPIHG
ncbi:restriction endonuclease subunit S [Spirosoma sp.]|uniref:restriction endonuclease subunit S n=1 Tax=Spirosoma sp. TaxID=1899569 RepID=UPI003B3BB446